MTISEHCTLAVLPVDLLTERNEPLRALRTEIGQSFVRCVQTRFTRYRFCCILAEMVDVFVFERTGLGAISITLHFK
jgi:hypothetical protein